MSDPIQLTLTQTFELERMSRAIDATNDVKALQGIAKQLLQAWHNQKAATLWVMRQQLDTLESTDYADLQVNCQIGE